MRESDTYQAIIEEGMAKVRVEGHVEGQLEYGHNVLFGLGRLRWGEKPDSAPRKRLEAIRDPRQLQKVTERMFNAKSWQDPLEKGR